jgi:hypothetical protein
MEATLTYSESTQEFLDFIQVGKDYRSESLDLLEEGKSRYVADLKLNFKNSFESGHLSKYGDRSVGIGFGCERWKWSIENLLPRECSSRRRD